jgi:UDP-N-acetylglucosamine 4,6-dehydratase/5-epimerase
LPPFSFTPFKKNYLMQTVLITGGTGFLGRNLAMRLKSTYNVILSGRSNKANHAAAAATGCTVIPLDVSNEAAVREAIAVYQPSIIVHAAASKYVDVSEMHPNECIDSNIKGSQNIARAAMEKGVALVVGISTDKAAPPCKTMYGLSKSVMEKLFLLCNGKSATVFTCLRFGNIAWSTGSVFPVWKDMLEKNGVIHTTGSHMRRYIFPVKDACGVIADAMSNAGLVAGKILCKKMESTQMSEVLAVFTEVYGGRFEKAPPRTGDSIDEIMIGVSETPWLLEIQLNGNDYYLLDFNSPAKPEGQRIDTENSPRLSKEALTQLVAPQYLDFI